MLQSFITNKVMYSILFLLSISVNSLAEGKINNNKNLITISTVMIHVSGNNDVKYQGAGIRVGEDKKNVYFTTANHVIENATEINISFYGNSKSSVNAFVQYRSTELDLAVVSVLLSDIRKKNIKFPRLSFVDQSYLSLGDKLSSIGHPPGAPWLVSLKHHTLLQINIKDNLSVMRISKGTIEEGHSGGVIFNQNNKIIGLITKRMQSVAVIVKWSVIHAQLKEWKIPTGVALSKDRIKLFEEVSSDNCDWLGNINGDNLIWATGIASISRQCRNKLCNTSIMKDKAKKVARIYALSNISEKFEVFVDSSNSLSDGVLTTEIIEKTKANIEHPKFCFKQEDNDTIRAFAVGKVIPFRSD